MYRTIFIIIIAAAITGCTISKKQNNGLVDLEIDGEMWRPVKSFENSSSNDKHYVVRQEADGSTVIRFGDGQHGARLPSNTSKVRVRYRGVYGQQGRVRLDDSDRDCK